MKHSPEDDRRLMAAWLDGSIAPGDFEVFQDRLRQDPDFRRKFRLEVNLETVLAQAADPASGLTAWSEEHLHHHHDESAKTFWRALPWWAWAAAAALVGLVGTGAFHWGGHSERQGAVVLEETNEGCAILTKAVNAEWLDDDGTMPRRGDTVSAGTLKLACGFAQIEFFSGATLLLEGDAELEIVSPSEAICHSGKVRVRVPPPARGFQLHAPGMRLVDLGTEFGLQVNSEDQSSEVHVFEGLVEAHPLNEELISLKQGEGLRKNGDFVRALAAVSPESFVDMEQMDAINTARETVRFDAWQKWQETARTDERLVAFYPFMRNTDWGRVVPNEATVTTEARNGGIVGASWTQGRWAKKDALEFKSPGDRVRVRLDGEYTGLTFACWVKVDGLDRKFSTLLQTDGFIVDEPHWQITGDGRLYFSIPHSENGKLVNEEFYSPIIFKRSDLLRWHHVAVTYDARSGEAVQFLDGRVVSRETSEERDHDIAAVRKVVYGSCELGNWGLPEGEQHESPVRNLNGCLDEFAIYREPLKVEELKAMYEAGRPE